MPELDAGLRASPCDRMSNALSPDGQADGRIRILSLVSIATMLALSVWFSTNAIAPALETEKSFDPGDIAWLTIAVQMGFVAGTFLIAFTNLADLLPARSLFGASALLAAALNLLILPVDGFGLMFMVRFLTGMTLAGVYPPAMKIISGWFVGGGGVALGTMVGALTLGSGSPHLLRSFFVDEWEATIAGNSALAALGGVDGIPDVLL